MSQKEVLEVIKKYRENADKLTSKNKWQHDKIVSIDQCKNVIKRHYRAQMKELNEWEKELIKDFNRDFNKMEENL